MSDFHVQVMRIGRIERHPNADTLSVAYVQDYPVIIRTSDFEPGALAVHVPIDAIVPLGHPKFAFLGDHTRIRPKRLRGVFSMGLLVPAEPEWTEGQDVQEALGIRRYEPPEEGELRPGGGLNARDTSVMPCYTDIEGLRRHPNALAPGEEVLVTEKLHGENFRACFVDGVMHVGSRTRIKLDLPDSQWWRAAHGYDLPARLAAYPNIAIYGESHGYTKGFNYGVARGKVGLRLFDAMDLETRRYLDVDPFLALAEALVVPTAPILYRGPWDPARVAEWAEGTTTLDAHMREGFVVRPVVERFYAQAGRAIFKRHGEAFLLRNAA